VKKPKPHAKQEKPDPKTPCDPADLLDEMDAAMGKPRTSEKISEVDDMDFPEGTTVPDKETLTLIADVIAAADEFRPVHQKLKDVVSAHRTKITLLKSKFGIRMGHAGHRVVVGNSAMMWEEFVTHYFGVTPRRLNQLLDVKDDKSDLTIVQTPDEEKSLFKKGVATAERKHEDYRLAMEEKLRVLGATTDAQKLAERVAVLEAALEENEIDAGKRIAELENINQQLYRNPHIPIAEAEAMKGQEPASAPTLEEWFKHKNTQVEYRYKLKYFRQASNHFLSGYRGTVSSVTFQKALKMVGDAKCVDDLAVLAAMLNREADDLRLLAQAVDPKDKK
jgi:hypothetical protein